MADYINAKQSGKQLDSDLRQIYSILENASKNDGKLLYIRHGKIALEDGDTLFDVIQLTQED